MILVPIGINPFLSAITNWFVSTSIRQLPSSLKFAFPSARVTSTFTNAPPSIFSTLLGIVTCSIFVPTNAPSCISFIPSFSFTDFKFLQSRNANAHISLTEPGIDISSILLSLNAYISMASTSSGITEFSHPAINLFFSFSIKQFPLTTYFEFSSFNFMCNLFVE